MAWWGYFAFILAWSWLADFDAAAASSKSFRYALVYASRAYLARHGRPKRVEDLRDHAIVRGEAGSPLMPGERTLDAHSSAERVDFRSQSIIARLAAIRDGVGIGMVGCFMGDRERSLVRLPFPVSDPNVNVWLLVHVDLRLNARVRAFTEHAYAALVAQRPLFEGRRAA